MLGVAGPIFAEFDCPVTTFLVTGFLDGKTWFWWDKLACIFDAAPAGERKVRLGRKMLRYQLDSPASRSASRLDLNNRLKDIAESERLACVEPLSRETNVPLPATPPDRFALLTWDEARTLERGVMSFAPHTVTHPILSTTSA